MTFGRCAIENAQHHMALRTSLVSWDRLLTLDRSIRVCDNTLFDFWIQVVDSVGGPAVKFIGTLEVEWLCELTLASCESGSEGISVFG
jgi:hypothetical protein